MATRSIHAKIRREGNSAQEVHHAVAVAATGEVPAEVRGNAGRHGPEEQGQAPAMVIGRDRARHDQRWNRGDRQSGLLKKYVGNDQRQADLAEHGIERQGHEAIRARALAENHAMAGIP